MALYKFLIIIIIIATFIVSLFTSTKCHSVDCGSDDTFSTIRLYHVYQNCNISSRQQRRSSSTSALDVPLAALYITSIAFYEEAKVVFVQPHLPIVIDCSLLLQLCSWPSSICTKALFFY